MSASEITMTWHKAWHTLSGHSSWITLPHTERSYSCRLPRHRLVLSHWHVWFGQRFTLLTDCWLCNIRDPPYLAKFLVQVWRPCHCRSVGFLMVHISVLFHITTATQMQSRLRTGHSRLRPRKGWGQGHNWPAFRSLEAMATASRCLEAMATASRTPNSEQPLYCCCC